MLGGIVQNMEQTQCPCIETRWTSCEIQPIVVPTYVTAVYSGFRRSLKFISRFWHKNTRRTRALWSVIWCWSESMACDWLSIMKTWSGRRRDTDALSFLFEIVLILQKNLQDVTFFEELKSLTFAVKTTRQVLIILQKLPNNITNPGI